MHNKKLESIQHEQMKTIRKTDFRENIDTDFSHSYFQEARISLR